MYDDIDFNEIFNDSYAAILEDEISFYALFYQNFIKQIRAHQNNEPCGNKSFDVPGIEEAVRGMAFIENTVKASQSETKWHSFSFTNK